ncbi:hypothetical protein F3Y22_tig00110402pilonHSYRG00168 [Hibiscus syriacus]|uniref:Fibronectin type III-like domain-containing protein n=1 Tax=Hibiscus syriacus TaxID=106335 RepID=A0A6A3AQY7_HIBSY|nr:hypothetical protein F3Y22_tig00110402pilonHSYRG00168 [Hibiscus syriacus]
MTELNPSFLFSPLKKRSIDQLSNNASGIPRLGIPPYQWWSESLHGIASNVPGVTFDGRVKEATSFPQVLLTAASFNRTLWFKMGLAIGVEAKAMYNGGSLRGVAIRDGFGRKRALGGGFNDDDGGDNRLMNFSRYSFNAMVTKQDMEDSYEPPFHSCIQQGKASCLMCSYNVVDGVPACVRGDLLQKLEMNEASKGIPKSHKKTRDAVALVLKAGNRSAEERPKFLPLNRNVVSSLAVIGPMANNISNMGGGYTVMIMCYRSIVKWQATGDYLAWDLPCLLISVLCKEGILCFRRSDVPCESDAGFNEAILTAKEADFVIVVAGLDLSQETEDHDRVSLLLPGKQMALVSSVAAASGRPMILVLTGGGPLDVSFAEGNPNVASIIWVGYPGKPEERHLQMSSLVTLTQALQLRILHQTRELDYIRVDEVTSCDSLGFYVHISVANVGDMDGSHVVMLFSRAPKIFEGTPEKQLIAFDRVHTSSYGSTETSILANPCIHLSIVDQEGERILPLGEHVLTLGDLVHSVLIET